MCIYIYIERERGVYIYIYHKITVIRSYTGSEDITLITRHYSKYGRLWRILQNKMNTWRGIINNI